MCCCHVVLLACLSLLHIYNTDLKHLWKLFQFLTHMNLGSIGAYKMGRLVKVINIVCLFIHIFKQIFLLNHWNSAVTMTIVNMFLVEGHMED